MKYGIPDALNGGPMRGGETGTELSQICDLLPADWGIEEQSGEGVGEIFSTETVLQKLGNNPSAGDQVGHGDGQIAVSIDLGGNLRGIPDELLCKFKR